MSEHRHRFPFTTLPTFSGGGDISFTLITHQTTQSDLAGDEVYFGEENAPFSYAVYLERADAITDRDIDQYIRSKDPDLHKKLFERRSRHVSRARALDNLTNSSSTAAKPRPTKAVQSSNSKSLKPRDQPIALQNTVDDVFSGYKELLVSALASSLREKSSFPQQLTHPNRWTSVGIAYCTGSLAESLLHFALLSLPSRLRPKGHVHLKSQSEYHLNRVGPGRIDNCCALLLDMCRVYFR